jgi:glycosyltransferase involved in cell wall biosynthesis
LARKVDWQIGEGTAPRISVLICTMNEAANLPHVLPYIPDWVSEVVLVDGHSGDDTVATAQRLRPGVRCFYQPGRGKGDALRYGLAQATGDIVVTLDADGATDPEEMPRFVRPLLSGCDFVKGSRFALGVPEGKARHRILGNLVITATFNILFRRRYTDLCSGYNAFWREPVAGALSSWTEDGFENEPFINARVARRGLRVREVGYLERARLSGEVKERSWRQGVKAIKSILRERVRG